MIDHEYTLPNKDLLLVIDMQNVYLPGREWACPSMPESAARIRALIDSGVVSKILFTKFEAPEDPEGCWQYYNEAYRSINENAELSAIIDELLPYANLQNTVVKSTYSSLKTLQIRDAVRETAEMGGRVLITGVVAECCVLATMMDLIDMGIPVVYLKDCISGQSSEFEKNICSIAQALDPVHVHVTDSSDYMFGL